MDKRLHDWLCAMPLHPPPSESDLLATLLYVARELWPTEQPMRSIRVEAVSNDGRSRSFFAKRTDNPPPDPPTPSFENVVVVLDRKLVEACRTAMITAPTVGELRGSTTAGELRGLDSDRDYTQHAQARVRLPNRPFVTSFVNSEVARCTQTLAEAVLAQVPGG